MVVDVILKSGEEVTLDNVEKMVVNDLVVTKMTEIREEVKSTILGTINEVFKSEISKADKDTKQALHDLKFRLIRKVEEQ